MRELDLLNWIRQKGRHSIPTEWVGPGDDCAVVTVGDERLVITTDQVLDGVHFKLADAGPAAASRKALARNLSDIAAMAALPLCATATVTLPAGTSEADAQAIYMGLADLGAQFNCPMVGGDVAIWDQPLSISVTVLGTPDGIEPVLRSGAHPGDALCVTGALGGAWQNGRDLTFTPRVVDARTLAEHYDLHAMIDLSDGLAMDLRHVCAASAVGAAVVAADVPIHADAAGLNAALGDGEDYELLFALPAVQAEALLAAQPLGARVSRIGTIVSGDQLTLIAEDGSPSPLPVGGWEHIG